VKDGLAKTCLCLRYVRGSFSDSQESTIQATYLDKRLNVGKKSVKLMIWDTAGQERFHALGPIYYREANGALLVYDITDRDSFSKVRNWVKELRKIVGKDIVLLIAGNKCDLAKHRQVSDEDAEKFAASVGATHIVCSAKTGKNVEQLFLELTKGMLVLQDKEGPPTGPSTSKPSRAVIEISKDEEKSKGCCGS